MNYSTTIPLITRRLVDLITQAAGSPVSSYSPQEAMQMGGIKPLNLFMLQIKEETTIRHRPPARLDPRIELQPVFSLLYLLHTNAPDAEAALGAALDVIFANPILPFEPPQEKLALTLVSFTVEELTQIWQACQAPLRPSIGIQARLVSGKV